MKKSQIKATSKYESRHYDKILVRLPKGRREIWKTISKSTDKSLNNFIVSAVEDKISEWE